MSDKQIEPESKKIDQSFIVQSALQLLQEEGIKKLSIRKLAERLHIKGASLYWHFKNKGELLEQIADEICKNISFPEESESWETQLIKIMKQYRNNLLRIRDSAYILVETTPTTPHRLVLIKKIAELFTQAGLNKNDIFSASWLLNNYVTSFVIEEYRFMQIQEEHSQSDDLIKAELPFDFSIPNMDKEFYFGLEILIEGLKKRVNMGCDSQADTSEK